MGGKTTLFFLIKVTNILVALSLNEKYEVLLAYACWFYRIIDNNSRINLISVADYSLTPPAYLMPYLEKEHEINRKLLSKIVDDLKRHNIDSTYKLITGRLIESFQKAICDLKIDYIILGHRSHLVKASSSEKMIRTLNIPMLVVRGAKSEGVNLANLKVNNILCITDFSENSLRALKLIERLFSGKDINLTILNVLSKARIDNLFNKANIEENKNQFCEKLIADRYNNLESLKIEEINTKLLCRMGIPYKVINETAIESNADIIFMGARGITSIEGVKLGSVSEAIIKTSPCPVMLVT